MVSPEGEQIGITPLNEALEQALNLDLDLVEVAENANPPVCRIMDYGKYKYEQKKKKSSKQSHSATLKEVKLRPGTDQHDLNFKLNNARRFLMEGDKVKISVMFRGREMVHTSRGRDQLQEVMKQLGPIAKMENPPRMEGRFLSMIVIGDREAIAEAKRVEESEQDAGNTEEATKAAEGIQEAGSSAAEQIESEEEAPQAAE